MAERTSMLDDGVTAISSFPSIDETRTVAQLLTQRTEQIGFERGLAQFQNVDYRDRHEDSHFKEWTVRTRERARASTQELLEELAELGFAWRDVARLVGVSVPAIQKWRRGEGASGENRHKLAGLLAACDQVADHYEIHDVASWFETPVRVGVPVTPVDLWASGYPELVFEHASGHETPSGILSRWDADWQQRYSSEFEVFQAGDGQLAIRSKR